LETFVSCGEGRGRMLTGTNGKKSLLREKVLSPEGFAAGWASEAHTSRV